MAERVSDKALASDAAYGTFIASHQNLVLDLRDARQERDAARATIAKLEAKNAALKDEVTRLNADLLYAGDKIAELRAALATSQARHHACGGEDRG